MKVLIIAPRGVNSDRINHQYLFPLGLAYISSVLKNAGHEVDCINHNHYAQPIVELLSDIFKSKGKYDFVCTGGISVFYRQIKEVVDAARMLDCETKIIVGGGIVSSEPELMFNALKPNYIVIGEGENAIVGLLACLTQKGDPAQLKGVGCQRPNGEFVCNDAEAPIMDLDSIPLPDLESFEFGEYLDHLKPTDQYFYDLHDYPRVYPIICSRSCPFICTFCFHPVGNKYRQRTVDSIMQELTVMVTRYKINTIAIYDELFSNKVDWVYDFCRRIKAFLAQLPWECKWACQMRVDKIDDEMLRVMKDAGCYSVSYGFESYSPVVLKSMQKYITPQQIDKAVHLTLKHDISIQANFIFGDIAETTQTAQETIDYWKEHIEAGIQMLFITPFPGTQLYRSCLERGIIKDRLDFITYHLDDFPPNMTKAMSEREFKQLEFNLNDTYRRYRTYAICDRVKKNHKGTFDLYVTCPHCKKNIVYGNFFILLKSYFVVMMYCRHCRRRFFLITRLYKLVLTLSLAFYKIIPPAFRVGAYNLLHKIQSQSYKFVMLPRVKKFLKKYILKANR